MPSLPFPPSSLLTPSTATPTTTAYDYSAKECFGEPAASLVPYLSETASNTGSLTSSLAASVAKNDASLFKWYIGGTTFAVDWADPSALQIIDDNATVSWENSSGTAHPLFPPRPSILLLADARCSLLTAR